MGHSPPNTYNLSLSEVCENEHCFLTLAGTLCADRASSVLVQVHFPGALRDRLKAEKTLVIAVAEIRSIVWVWAYCWCSPGLVPLDEDGQGGQEGCAKKQQYKLNSLWVWYFKSAVWCSGNAQEFLYHRARSFCRSV